MSTSLRSNRTNASIVVWAGDDVARLEWNSQPINVPPINEVATAGKGIYRYGSAVDAHGRKIPGTVLLENQYQTRENGTVKVFDADAYLDGLESVNKSLVERGLKVVTEVDEIERVRPSLRELWETAQAKADGELIQLEIDCRMKWERAHPGVPCPPSSDEASIKAAVQRNLNRAQKRATSSVSMDELLTSIGGVAKSATATTTQVQAPAPTPVKSEAPSIQAIAEHLYDKAEEHSITLTKAELKGLLGKDASSMESVRSKLEEAGVALSL